MKFALSLLLALAAVGCTPCKSDQDCGSLGLCVQGDCHDFTNDNIPCSCSNASECKDSRLSCTGGRCETPLGTPVMCH